MDSPELVMLDTLTLFPPVSQLLHLGRCLSNNFKGGARKTFTVMVAAPLCCFFSSQFGDGFLVTPPS